MSACRILVTNTYVDKDAQRDRVLAEICETQHRTMLLLQHIEGLIKDDDRGKSRGARGAVNTNSSSAGTAVPGKQLPPVAPRGGPGMMRPGPAAGSGINSDGSSAATQELKTKSSSGIPSWAIMIGIYVLFNYVLK